MRIDDTFKLEEKKVENEIDTPIDSKSLDFVLYKTSKLILLPTQKNQVISPDVFNTFIANTRNYLDFGFAKDTSDADYIICPDTMSSSAVKAFKKKFAKIEFKEKLLKMENFIELFNKNMKDSFVGWEQTYHPLTKN